MARLLRIGVLRVRVARTILVVVLACGVIPAVAAAAGRATLKIKVPARVHPNQHFRVTITVTFHRSAALAKPYLVAYVQFAGSACKPTANAERALPTAVRELDFAGKVAGSPFTDWERWRAGTMTGTRRVCAYLYSRAVSPRNHAKPLLRASATYRDV